MYVSIRPVSTANSQVEQNIVWLSRAVAWVKKKRAMARITKNDPKNDDPGYKIFFGSGARVFFFLPTGDPKKWRHLVFLKFC